jgi:hypothetical protein
MTCDHCPCVPDLEARIEALLDELHDVKVAAVRERSVERALRAGHPSTRRDGRAALRLIGGPG